MRNYRATGVLAIALAGCATTDIRLCNRVTVAPQSAGIAVGDSTQFAASYDRLAACTPPAPEAQLRWSTSDPSIAQVDSVTGMVTGVTPGSVDITAHLPGLQPPLGAGRALVFEPLYDRILTVRERITCTTPSCSAWSGTGATGLWTLATDGSDPRVVRDSMRDPKHARVSPDGRAILFGDRDTLYIVDGAGQAVRPVPTGLPYNFEPSWSPDGRWILFAGVEDPLTTKLQIFKVRPDGTDLRQLTNDPFGAHDASWSPDGATIVFVRDSMANGREAGAAMLMDTSGTVIRAVSGTLTPFYGRLPEWSPGGTALVFIERPCPMRLDIATGQYDTLGVFDTNEPASWSPTDGRIIVSGGEIRYFDPALPVGLFLLRGLGPDSMFNSGAFYTPRRPGTP